MIKNRFHASVTTAMPTPKSNPKSSQLPPASLPLLFGSGELLPHWMANDPLIMSGYRRPTASFMACFQSLFYVHNETVNIWSHFLTAICFGCFVWQSFSYGDTAENWMDWVVVRYYMLSGIACMMFSVRKIDPFPFVSLCFPSFVFSCRVLQCKYLS
jgi:hypothetical protein